MVSLKDAANSRDDKSLSLLLPDKSVAVLDQRTLWFRSVETSQRPAIIKSRSQPPAVPIRLGKLDPKEVNELINSIQHPHWRFEDCFRRTSDLPSYSPKRSKHDFNVKFITRLHDFPGSYRGGLFSSSESEWRFLDGGIISHSGYGWGSHSWTVVKGAEALRAVCMFFGIKQPRTIKGELSRRPLSVLLEEMTREQK